MKKVLFIDRDGTLVIEPPEDYQLDRWDKLSFYPGVITGLKKIVDRFDYELVLVTNQDGLGTEAFPADTFWPIHNFILKTLQAEGIKFSEVLIDSSFPEDNSVNRKPQLGMVGKYLTGEYDLSGSFVIGDRLSDMEFAKNLGCSGIFLGEAEILKNYSATEKINIALSTKHWSSDNPNASSIYSFLKKENNFQRTATVTRTTKETDIRLELNLDIGYYSKINTGLGFFDHMLDQIAKHGNISLDIAVHGDLQIDEHHTIEDTALVLGEAFNQALGNKKGINRYGFCLPMDDCLAQVAIDFGGRPWCVWEADFQREKIGDVPTEMFFHFFKSFSDTAKCNLNIKAEGKNEHHKIEAIFKAFAKSIGQAIQRDLNSNALPSTKGIL